MALNPADYSVISQALIAATHEMGAKLVRSAYSTIVREASDASAALLDPDGQAVAQAELMIQQLGSLSATFGPCAEHHPVDTLVEGDFYINNDPYYGGQHLPDVFIFSPVFFEGELVAFGATVAHHIDIGGGAPGLNVNAREIYQEGLIIPPSRYNLDDDWNGGRLERLIATNVRVPDQTIGDMNAQFAGNAIGAARVRQLCRKYGPEAVRETMASLIDYSERRMRAAIAAAPDGVYHGEDVIDNDWVGGGPVHVRVAVTIDGDEVAIDFDGTSDQVGSNMNAPFASTVAAAFGCVKAVLTSADIPYNAGSTRPATVTAPYGSLLNPKPPAAVRARMTATNRAFNAVMKALARAVPEKVIATGFDTTTGPYLSRRSEAGYKVYHEVIGGGYGASARADGCSGVDGPLGNCSKRAGGVARHGLRVLQGARVQPDPGFGRRRRVSRGLGHPAALRDPGRRGAVRAVRRPVPVSARRAVRRRARGRRLVQHRARRRDHRACVQGISLAALRRRADGEHRRRGRLRIAGRAIGRTHRRRCCAAADLRPVDFEPRARRCGDRQVARGLLPHPRASRSATISSTSAASMARRISGRGLAVGEHTVDIDQIAYLGERGTPHLVRVAERRHRPLAASGPIQRAGHRYGRNAKLLFDARLVLDASSAGLYLHPKHRRRRLCSRIVSRKE